MPGDKPILTINLDDAPERAASSFVQTARNIGRSVIATLDAIAPPRPFAEDQWSSHYYPRPVQEQFEDTGQTSHEI